LSTCTIENVTSPSGSLGEEDIR